MEPMWLFLVTIALYLSSFQWLAFSGQQQQMNLQQQNQQQTQLLMTMPLINQIPANKQSQESELLDKLIKRLDLKKGLEYIEEFIQNENQEPTYAKPLPRHNPTREKFHQPRKYVSNTPRQHNVHGPQRPLIRDSVENPRHLNWNLRRPNPEVFSDEGLRGGEERCDHVIHETETFGLRPPHNRNLHMVSSNDEDGFPHELLPSAQNLAKSPIKPEKSLRKPLESFKSPMGSLPKPSESAGKPRKSFGKGHYDFSNAPIASRAVGNPVGGRRGNLTTVPPPYLPFKYPNKPFPYTRDFTPKGLGQLGPYHLDSLLENSKISANEPTTVPPLELDTFNGASQSQLDQNIDTDAEIKWDEILMNIREKIETDALKVIEEEHSLKNNSNSEKNSEDFIQEEIKSQEVETTSEKYKSPKTNNFFDNKTASDLRDINSYIISQILENRQMLNELNYINRQSAILKSKIRSNPQADDPRKSMNIDERSINQFRSNPHNSYNRQPILKNPSKVNKFIRNALKTRKVEDGKMGWG